jgi:hypothetical protein
MNANEAKQIFQNAIDTSTDADRTAKLELLREFFTNEEFRKAMAEHLFNQQEEKAQ